ncbi:hypothetical protein HGP17_17670 [Rhizobium sp. P38BS-XIX]|nr:DUF6622 family protein [Rhizobium sp. P38BS-XIX]NLR98650.1 hypothetical protein [Rhizobium sp. P38BS-XIX]
MTHVPLYVYVLFLLLIWMGLSQCRPRRVRLERLAIMPVLMAIMGARGFDGLFVHASVADMIFALAGLGIGAAVGWRHVSGWRIAVEKAKRSLSLPGDIMMLVIILATFAFEFLLHAAAASHAAWFSASFVPPLAALVWAGFVGMSLGRNLHLISRYMSVPAQPADQAR